MKKVMFISSTGGHLDELQQLNFKQYDYTVVTEKTDSDKDLKDKYIGKVYYLAYGTRKNLIKYFFIFLYNFFRSIYLFNKIKPDVVVSTGTHTAVPMCYIAHFHGKKVIWIETFANRSTRTLAGRIVYPIADTFVVQWEEMKKLYKKAVYWGAIY
jgi:UDP-N-acetylglucosamine:LPS N-acetylglucosamine transferase